MTSVHMRLVKPVSATLGFSEVSYFAGLKGEAFSAFTPGDLCILMTSNGGNSQTPPDLLSGWTAVNTQDSDASHPIAARLQAKILAPGDSAVSAPTGTRISGAILRGATVDDIEDSAGSSATTGNTMTFDAITGTGLDLVLAFAVFRSDQTIVFPTGFTSKATREVGEGAPIIAVGRSSATSFAGDTAEQGGGINGGVAFTVGIKTT